MWFHSLLASWKSGISRSRRSQPRPARRGTRLVLEQLENRSLPSTYSAASVSALIADINAANTAGGANTISLTAPTTSPYVLTAVNNTTNGNTGLPVIAAKDNLTIVGNGYTIERSTATGTPDFRLLEVAKGGSLTLENLTLQGGIAASGGWTVEGGAIYSQGTLVLNGVTVQDNGAVAPPDSGVSAAGGGIYSYGVSVTLEGGTIVQDNEAIGSTNANVIGGGNAYGGGLYASGATVTVTNSSLLNNTAAAANQANGPNGSACGGGLYASSAKVILTNAVVDGNAATLTSDITGGGAFGGGLYLNILVSPATLTASATLTNCTVQGNSALTGGYYGEGGGLFVAGHGVTLQGDTIQANSASFAGGGVYVQPHVGSVISHGEDGFTGIGTTFTALASAINATQTTIYLSYSSTIFKGDTIVIDSEAMIVEAVTTVNSYTSLLGVIRGVDGTKAASHAAGASVYPALKLDASTLTNLVNNTAPSATNIGGPYLET